MKFSHGNALTAGSANTILTVPAGYDAIITYLFISNTTGSSKNIDARWVHNSVNIDFLAGKNVGSNEFLEFGGQSGEFLVAKEGDTITLTPLLLQQETHRTVRQILKTHYCLRFFLLENLC